MASYAESSLPDPLSPPEVVALPEQNNSFLGMGLGCISVPVRLGPNENFGLKGKFLMKRFAIILAISVAVTTLPMLGQQAGVGNIARNAPALDKLISPGTKTEKLHGGFRFIEGPVWMRTGPFLLFSDLQNNAIMKWSPDGSVSVFRKAIFSGSYPDGVQIGSNGLTLDKQGRVVAAEHGNRRVSRIEKDGTITVLADHYQGKRLNSPNDLVCKSNGDVYFTDPPGLYRTYPEGPDAPKRELDFAGVYRVSAPGKVDLVTKDVPYPNGLAFSPDEKKLYIASSRPEKFWMVYNVVADGSLSNGKKFFDATSIPGEGVPDGMKVDRDGNIYATGPAGIMIFTPSAKLLGTIELPEIPANLNWGDPDGKALYITARTSLYRIRMNVAGMRP
jgi:gluconolactonase